jgi:hypothetical protein
MKDLKLICCLLVILGTSAIQATAAKRYFVGNGTNLNWNTTTNWSSASGGASGASVPGTNDTAYFDQAAPNKCVLDINITIRRLELKSTFGDTLNQNGKTITTSGAGPYVQGGGVFIGSTTNISLGGSFSQSGGTFNATAGTMQVGANFAFSGGTFNNNRGLVKFINSTTMTGSITLSQVEFNSVGGLRNFTIASGTIVTADSTVTISGSSAIIFSTGDLYVTHDINVTNTSTNGNSSATFTINGSVSQTITADPTLFYFGFPDIVINKSADTLHLVGKIGVRGNWTYTSGAIDAVSSTVAFYNGATITGNHSLYNVIFNASVSSARIIASGTTFTVSHALTISGAGSLVINTGTIDVNGDLTITNSGTAGGGSGKIKFSGSHHQILTGTNTTGEGRLPDIEINKSGDTLEIRKNVSVAGGNWKYTNGIIKAGGSSVLFIGAHTITGTHSLNNVEFTSGGTSTIALGTVLTVDSLLSFTGTSSLGLNTGTIYAHGNINATHTSTTSTTSGTGTIEINGIGNQTFNGSTTVGSGRLPNITINKAGGTLTLTNHISTSGNWTYVTGTVSPGTSTVHFMFPASTTITLTGSHTLANVTFDQISATGAKTLVVASGTILTVSGTLTLAAGSANLSINTGTIYAQGNLVISNLGTGSGGTGTIEINGTVTQSLNGSGVAGSGKLCAVTINKSSGTLNLVDIISFDKAFTYTAGTVSGGTSTCAFYGSGTLDPENSAYSVPFYDVIIAASRTLSGKLTALHDLTINSSQTLTSGGFDINVGRNWTDNGTFSTAGGYVTFDGTGTQTIAKTIGSTETFKKLRINNSATNTITLSNPVTVTDTLRLTEGKVITTSTNILKLNDNAGCIGGSDTAYVSGPMKKLGNDAFTFPIGKTTLTTGAYHPYGINAPASTSDEYSAEYFVADPTSAYGSTLGDSVEAVSTCEYWLLKRTAGSSSVKSTLGWNTNMCISNNNADLEVAYWSGSKWYSLGQSALSITGPRGTATANSTLLPSTSGTAYTFNKGKIADYTELKRKLDGGYYIAANNKVRFKYDEEYMDVDQQLSFNIYKAATNQIVLTNASFTSVLTQVNLGDNRYGYDLSTFSLASGFYILEVINEKQEKFYLRFKI